MTRATLALLAMAAVAGSALAAEPLVPAPPGTKLVLEAEGVGVQVYNCQSRGGDSYAWVFEAPEADLFDSRGRQIGRHYGGPTWRMDDGSSIVGEVQAKADAPGAKAIPWLLLKVRDRDGSGALEQVTFVRRSNTEGGLPPQGGCDISSTGAQARMRYSALYQFFAPAK